MIMDEKLPGFENKEIELFGTFDASEPVSRSSRGPLLPVLAFMKTN